MILKESFYEDIDEGGLVGKVKRSEIKVDALKKALMVLTKMYKDPIKTIVQEYSSNAWDAHVEANNTDQPIIVTLDCDKDELLIKDYGTGMTEEFIYDVYINFFDSTKNNSVNLLGAYGLGSKSAISYTNAFYFESVKDGKKSYGIFSKDHEGYPSGEVYNVEDTPEPNGTLIKIPIKHNDINAFIKSFRNTLLYFPNIYVDIKSKNVIYSSFDNKAKIFEGKYFKYNEAYSNSPSILLGNIPYPIDWNVLDIGIYDSLFPSIGIKFGIDELKPVPSRDNIEYSSDVIPLIRERIAQAFDEVVSMYKKDNDVIDNPLLYKERCNRLKREDTLIVNLDDDTILDFNYNYIVNHCPNLFKAVNIFPKLKGYEELEDLYNYLDLFIDYKIDSKMITKNGNLINYKSYKSILSLVRYTSNYLIYYRDTNPEKLKEDYLKAVAIDSDQQILFISKKKQSLSNYKRLLFENNKTKKQDYRKYIVAYQKINKDLILSHFKKYSDVVVDEEWSKKVLKSRYDGIKERNRIRKLNDIILYKQLYPGNNINSKEYRLSTLSDSNYIYIYGTKEERTILYDLYDLVTNIRKNGIVKVIFVAKKYLKQLKNLENACSIYDFYDSYPKMVKQICYNIYCNVCSSPHNNRLSFTNDEEKVLFLNNLLRDTKKFPLVDKLCKYDNSYFYKYNLFGNYLFYEATKNNLFDLKKIDEELEANAKYNNFIKSKILDKSYIINDYASRSHLDYVEHDIAVLLKDRGFHVKNKYYLKKLEKNDCN